MPVFALTIFIGAFLLFQVQPLIGKYILPWFGGGPGVWATCMLFFQVLLLGGYAYAHGLSRWFKPRTQAIIHTCLMLAALVFLPIIPADSWKPTGAEDPSLRILGLLAASIGLPYLVLSATGPLMQHWFSLSHPGRNPYRLYALSNVGSLLALVSYPFVFETNLARKAQAEFWGWGLVLYVLVAAGCAWALWRALPAKTAEGQTAVTGGRSVAAGSISRRLLWLLLPACASALLLAVTNKLCLDVAVIPFLWVAPLAVYLLTFIIAFDSPRWYQRTLFGMALMVALPALVWAMQSGPDWSVIRQIITYCVGLFICCMVCHGELYRLRPPAEHLTGYYLLIATGGALGGVFVALLAPLLFDDYYELHWSLLACGALFLGVVLASGSDEAGEIAQPGTGSPWRWLGTVLPFLVLVGLERVAVRYWAEDSWATKVWLNAGRGLLVLVTCVAAVVAWRRWWFSQGAPARWRGWTAGWLALGLLALAAGLWADARKSRAGIVHTSRNFYGVLTVYENEPENPDTHHVVLQHGRITHGLQFVDPLQASWATTYFGQETGVGLAIQSLPEAARQIGIVGLGTGTLAAYGRNGDRIRFYEINPEVVHLASTEFTYLTNCPGKVEVALGDARLSMEREAPQNFDLLALDAFSSDSIPVHLLTLEAFELYNKHVRTNGVLAVHISNHYLDLEPVVLKLAGHFGYRAVKIDYEERDDTWWVYSSTWMLLTRDPGFLEGPMIKPVARPPTTRNCDIRLWTDDFASLFQILQ